MSTDYIPALGDIVWLSFDPQAGREQAGFRPALVLSPKPYNGRRGMMIVCPMTSRIRNYVFEVVVTHDPPSVILVDQIKSLDWHARKAIYKGTVSADVLVEVQAKMKALLEL